MFLSSGVNRKFVVLIQFQLAMNEKDLSQITEKL